MRDSSRPRRERSTSGREREERDRERDRDRRGDRERDDYRRDREDFRRERDDYLRRDRDLDKDVDVDDPRRWRDDGKRDERVAARREREHRDRIRDRPPREDGWEERHGGRWTVVEDRDSRNKRSSGRDRRSGILDDGKEKDDRKERDRDREREKEKEKEPAWMDTYIPTSTGAGILGGKGGEGELDGIQAFKKGMKAKEQKDLSSDEALEPSNIDGSNGSSTAGIISSSALSSDKPLDEIQLFKLMMKKEQEQKNLQKLSASATEPTLTGPSLKEVENGVSGLMRIRDQRIVSTPSNGTSRQRQVLPRLMYRFSQVSQDYRPSLNLNLHWSDQALRCYQKIHPRLHHQMNAFWIPRRLYYLYSLTLMESHPLHLPPPPPLHPHSIPPCLNHPVPDSFLNHYHQMFRLPSHRTKDLRALKRLLNSILHQDLAFWLSEPAAPPVALVYRVAINNLRSSCTEYTHRCNSIKACRCHWIRSRTLAFHFLNYLISTTDLPCPRRRGPSKASHLSSFSRGQRLLWMTLETSGIMDTMLILYGVRLWHQLLIDNLSLLPPSLIQLIPT